MVDRGELSPASVGESVRVLLLNWEKQILQLLEATFTDMVFIFIIFIKRIVQLTGIKLPSRFEEAVYGLLSEEPMTPSEVAERLGINYKTAKDALLHLAATRRDVRYRNSERIHIFWRYVGFGK